MVDPFSFEKFKRDLREGTMPQRIAEQATEPPPPVPTPPSDPSAPSGSMGLGPPPQPSADPFSFAKFKRDLASGTMPKVIAEQAKPTPSAPVIVPHGFSQPVIDPTPFLTEPIVSKPGHVFKSPEQSILVEWEDPSGKVTKVQTHVDYLSTMQSDPKVGRIVSIYDINKRVMVYDVPTTLEWETAYKEALKTEFKKSDFTKVPNWYRKQFATFVPGVGVFQGAKIPDIIKELGVHEEYVTHHYSDYLDMLGDPLYTNEGTGVIDKLITRSMTQAVAKREYTWDDKTFAQLKAADPAVYMTGTSADIDLVKDTKRWRSEELARAHREGDYGFILGEAFSSTFMGGRADYMRESLLTGIYDPKTGTTSIGGEKINPWMFGYDTRTVASGVYGDYKLYRDKDWGGLASSFLRGPGGTMVVAGTIGAGTSAIGSTAWGGQTLFTVGGVGVKPVTYVHAGVGAAFAGATAAGMEQAYKTGGWEAVEQQLQRVALMSPLMIAAWQTGAGYGGQIAYRGWQVKGAVKGAFQKGFTNFKTMLDSRTLVSATSSRAIRLFSKETGFPVKPYPKGYAKYSQSHGVFTRSGISIEKGLPRTRFSAYIRSRGKLWHSGPEIKYAVPTRGEVFRHEFVHWDSWKKGMTVGEETVGIWASRIKTFSFPRTSFLKNIYNKYTTSISKLIEQGRMAGYGSDWKPTIWQRIKSPYYQASNILRKVTYPARTAISSGIAKIKYHTTDSAWRSYQLNKIAEQYGGRGARDFYTMKPSKTIGPSESISWKPMASQRELMTTMEQLHGRPIDPFAARTPSKWGAYGTSWEAYRTIPPDFRYSLAPPKTSMFPSKEFLKTRGDYWIKLMDDTSSTLKFYHPVERLGIPSTKLDIRTLGGKTVTTQTVTPRTITGSKTVSYYEPSPSHIPIGDLFKETLGTPSHPGLGVTYPTSRGGWAAAHGFVDLRYLEWLEEGIDTGVSSHWGRPGVFKPPSMYTGLKVTPVVALGTMSFPKTDIFTIPESKFDIGTTQLQGPKGIVETAKGLDVTPISISGYDVATIPASALLHISASALVQEQVQQQKQQLKHQQLLITTPVLTPITSYDYGYGYNGTPHPPPPKIPRIPWWPDLGEGKKKLGRRKELDIFGKGYRYRKWKVPTMEEFVKGW